MFKRFLFIALAAGFLASCGGEATTTDTDNANDTIAEVTENELTLIALDEFEKLAGNFVDQEIKVIGIVDHVCKHGGKRLFLVADGTDLHIEGEERFDESMVGNEVTITGIVREFRIDEGYCLQMEEDNILNHKEGETEEEHFEMKKEEIKYYRDSMAAAEVDHLSFYSLDYVSHIVNE